MLPLGGIHKKGGGAMTAYEILSIVIGILALLISLGNMFVALLTFFDKRKKRKSKKPILSAHRIGRVLKDIS